MKIGMNPPKAQEIIKEIIESGHQLQERIETNRRGAS
jgi:hypothetical protein